MCGLRVSEALSLKVDDIDFSLNCLSVRKAKSDIVTEDIGISTHDLTKRSTGKSCFLCKETGISTHDLTKRSTSISDSFQSSFLFQLTTSRRGRPSKKITSVICTNISTHDLTKRSTCIGVDNESAELFQLTTSRRGRRNKPLSFQSHSLFQLTTSRRGRLMPQGMFRPPAYFNSRHHEEVDDFRKGLPSFPFSFQLTTSRRGRQQNCIFYSSLLHLLLAHCTNNLYPIIIIYIILTF